MSIQSSRETINHYSCNKCNGWWSIASIEHDWTPKKLFCPYCGVCHIDIDRSEYEKIRGQAIDENVPPEI
jgi:predicted RNA-binding Zn-ribbon protein involved in translation (DUF1610 family)